MNVSGRCGRNASATEVTSRRRDAAPGRAMIAISGSTTAVSSTNTESGRSDRDGNRWTEQPSAMSSLS